MEADFKDNDSRKPLLHAALVDMKHRDGLARCPTDHYD